MENYLVVIERGEHNFSAYSPDVVGCVATGATIEDVLQQMRDALFFHLEDLSWQGEPLPTSQGLAFHLESIQPQAGDLLTFIPIEWNTVKGSDNPLSNLRGPIPGRKSVASSPHIQEEKA